MTSHRSTIRDVLDPGFIPAPRRAQAELFVVPKRARGRPKAPIANTPSTADFHQTAAAIVGIASGRHWLAAKERVRARARVDKRLTGSPREVLNYLLDVLSRERGYDWRARSTIAEDCGTDTRTVARALDRLWAAGYILREVRFVGGNGRATNEGRRTIIALVDAAVELSREPSNERGKKTSTRGANKSNERGKQLQREGVKNTDERVKQTPLTLRENPARTRARGLDFAEAMADSEGHANAADHDECVQFWLNEYWTRKPGEPAAEQEPAEVLALRVETTRDDLLAMMASAHARGDQDEAARLLRLAERVDQRLEGLEQAIEHEGRARHAALGMEPAQ